MQNLLAYLRVFATYGRNSLVRDMTFRANFVIECVSSIGWVLISLGFYVLVFQYTPMIGHDTGWGKYEFFVFVATTLLINSVVEGLFMTNADELSEMIRHGSLDFALLKPMDTQFLVSLRRIDWSAAANFLFGWSLLVYSLVKLGYLPGPLQALLYLFFLACGTAISYSLMIALAATSVWLGRNQTLYDFWFYITTFGRYPMEIYAGPAGGILRRLFTFVLPVLLVTNVPARVMLRGLHPQFAADWWLPLLAVVATAGSLAVSRWVFRRALLSYRSASS